MVTHNFLLKNYFNEELDLTFFLHFQIAELLPGILTQLGSEGLSQLKRLANNVGMGSKILSSVEEGKEEEDIPDLVENFENVANSEQQQATQEEAEKKIEEIIQEAAVAAEKATAVITPAPVAAAATEEKKETKKETTPKKSGGGGSGKKQQSKDKKA